MLLGSFIELQKVDMHNRCIRRRTSVVLAISKRNQAKKLFNIVIYKKRGLRQGGILC